MGRELTALEAKLIDFTVSPLTILIAGVEFSILLDPRDGPIAALLAFGLYLGIGFLWIGRTRIPLDTMIDGSPVAELADWKVGVLRLGASAMWAIVWWKAYAARRRWIRGRAGRSGPGKRRLPPSA